MGRGAAVHLRVTEAPPPSSPPWEKTSASGAQISHRRASSRRLSCSVAPARHTAKPRLHIHFDPAPGHAPARHATPWHSMCYRVSWNATSALADGSQGSRGGRGECGCVVRRGSDAPSGAPPPTPQRSPRPRLGLRRWTGGARAMETPRAKGPGFAGTSALHAPRCPRGDCRLEAPAGDEHECTRKPFPLRARRASIPGLWARAPRTRRGLDGRVAAAHVPHEKLAILVALALTGCYNTHHLARPACAWPPTGLGQCGADSDRPGQSADECLRAVTMIRRTTDRRMTVTEVAEKVGVTPKPHLRSLGEGRQDPEAKARLARLASLREGGPQRVDRVPRPVVSLVTRRGGRQDRSPSSRFLA